MTLVGGVRAVCNSEKWPPQFDGHSLDMIALLQSLQRELTMPKLMDKALERVRTWPDAREDEAAELLLALDELGTEPVSVSDEELAAIDEALAQAGRGEFADPKAVEAVFQRFRK